MTVGEKIQFYRKKLGLSQEELGQKMFVSRQTISLWEMDKTLPTIDNLMRLKDIFGISVEDILSQSVPTEASNTLKKEAYSFKYSEREVQEIYKGTRAPLVKRFATFVLVVFILFIMAAGGKASVFAGVVLGCFVVGLVFYVKTFIAIKKTWAESKKRLLENTYSYEVFDEYFVLNVCKDGEITKTQKVFFEEVEKAQNLGKYLILTFSGQNYIVRRDELSTNSAFKSLCKKTAEKKQGTQPSGRLKTISTLLLVLSVVALFGAMVCLAILNEYNSAMTENAWVFFLFLPLPLASIAFGLYLKKKGVKYKKNVIVGIIMSAILCIYGSFSFVFAGIYSHSDQPILQAEQTLGIDIPTHKRINTQDWTKGTQSVPRGYIYSTSDIYFKDANVQEFEKTLDNDSKWLKEIPSDLASVSSIFCDMQDDAYYIIYNKDTGKFNELPTESGKYVFINVIYSAKDNFMKLVEYQIDYTK